MQYKWDTFREKAIKEPEKFKSEFNAYLNKVFENKIPQYILPANSKLYRARIIHSDEGKITGVNPYEFNKEICRLFFSDEEINKLKDGIEYVSYESAIWLKMQNSPKFTEEQLKAAKKLLVKYCKKGFYGFSEDGCGVPPICARKNGRLNTKDDPYLYTAIDRDTAIYEMRPGIKQFYSLAEGHTVKDLTLIDLSNSELNENKNIVFSIIASKMSAPNTDDREEFYNITQYLSHIIEEKGYDGIYYQSAVHKGGKNVLLFREDNVKFTSSEIATINDVHIDYSIEYPLKIDANVKEFVKTSLDDFNKKINKN